MNNLAKVRHLLGNRSHSLTFASLGVVPAA
jgi:hypothetical protein